MKMDKPPLADRKAYYAQGESWANDVQGSLTASRRLAWIVAGAAVVIAVLEAIALAALAPLKTVVPYTITVDRQTGYIQMAQPLKPGVLSQDTAITQAFLAQYVLARETFDVTDLQAKYREVAAWTTGPARDVYVKTMQRSNPQSPVNLNDPTTVVRITIRSVSMLSSTSALVRFDAERGVVGGPAERRPYAAVVGFRYAGQPMRAEDRFLNPLGFQVTAYRRDAETAGPVPVAAAGALVTP
jgi:type IV secretion system protein VirB8